MLKNVLIGFIGFFMFSNSYCFGTFYSQCGQDEFVYKSFFQNLDKGVFVDIGAHSGIEISNTYFFEKELGWTGVCIEPIPQLFEQLQQNRSCVCVQGCISDSSGSLPFIQFPYGKDWFSGLKDKFPAGHLENLRDEWGFTSYEIIDVNCYLLSDILNQNQINHINFLSLDTEGGELDILKSIDFSSVVIDVITVEDNYNDPELLEFLQSKNFDLVKRLYQDAIFARKGFNLSEQ